MAVQNSTAALAGNYREPDCSTETVFGGFLFDRVVAVLTLVCRGRVAELVERFEFGWR
jgi:hypothetical protein